MKKTIHRLRQRPHQERRAIAAVSALSLTAVMFVGWSAFFLNSLGTSTAPTNMAATDAALVAPKTPQPVVVSNPNQSQDLAPIVTSSATSSNPIN